MKIRRVFSGAVLLTVLLSLCGCGGSDKFTVEDALFLGPGRPAVLTAKNSDNGISVTKNDFSREMELVSAEPVTGEDGKLIMGGNEKGHMTLPNGIEVTVSFEGKTYHGVIKPGTAIKSETVDGKVYLLFDPAVFK